PPNSNVTRFKLLEAWLIMCLPTSVEPVKAILFTRGWLTNSAPVSPKPVTTLNTPSGKPASCVNFAIYKAESGVCSAGFKIIVQPVASAAPIFQAAINNGKFHGIIRPTTPVGSLHVYVKKLPATGMVCPTSFVAQPA